MNKPNLPKGVWHLNADAAHVDMWEWFDNLVASYPSGPVDRGGAEPFPRPDVRFSDGTRLYSDEELRHGESDQQPVSG